mgnify:CR=1 FL=1
MTKTTVLIEQLDLSEATLPTEGRFIEGVVLIRAGMSANRRYYGEDVLQKAVAVFEGARAFDNHKRGERSVAELTGWYKNVRYENGMLKADRHFTNTDAGRNVFAVVEDIVSGRAPKTLAGLSINATGTGKTAKFDDGDALNVESITFAQSVDDVVQPAAGGTYALTASDGDALTRELLQAMTFEEWWGVARPEFVRRVTNELKNARETDAVKAAKAQSASQNLALGSFATVDHKTILVRHHQRRRKSALDRWRGGRGAEEGKFKHGALQRLARRLVIFLVGNNQLANMAQIALVLGQDILQRLQQSSWAKRFMDANVLELVGREAIDEANQFMANSNPPLERLV